ncbi:response regulator [Psychrobacter sp. FDAARGOS_221]|uniref:response regulator n=1 Tax=Psychrobacter sp. FDAARGOS_221 TaxID=1975705 RepID=UPI000BB587FA|nr:response regulator [Psychrobacter sp. FDAARGOS_221]PNK60993.1 response regulator [Psychrobacter sp. FDAARGOS_221]
MHKKVLVVEDSQSEMARFRNILSNSNFEVLEANNGQQGVEMAAQHLPDVILMDIVMPEMNGFQATRKITRNDATAHIPVVMISTKNQETDKVWGKRQGAKAYLTKPVYEAELLSTIESVIGQ